MNSNEISALSQSPPQPMAVIPASDRPWHHNRVLRVSAAVAAGTMVLSGCEVNNPFESSSAESSSGQSADGQVEQAPATPENIEPIVEAVPDDIRQDFEKALAVDTCETKVTVDEVTSIYQKLMLTHEQPNLTLEGLQQRAADTIQELEASKQSVGLVPLPEAYIALKADAESSHQIPLEQYQAVATGYFNQLGIRAIFNWTEEQSKLFNDQYDELLSSVDFTSSPVTEDVPGANPYVRNEILAAMRSFAAMPPSLLKAAQIEFVAMVDIDDPAFDGQYFTGDNGLIIDVSGASGPSPPTEEHEVSHGLDYVTCALMMRATIGNNDAALESLNDGYKYHVYNSETGQFEGENDTTLATNQLIEGKYRSLYFGGPTTIGSEIVTASPYASTTDVEDKASDLAIAFVGNSLADFYAETGDKKKLGEKLALLLARVSKIAPNAVNHYTAMFSAARVKGQVVRHLDESFMKQHEIIISNDNFENDPEYQGLLAEEVKYDELNTLLSGAMSGS